MKTLTPHQLAVIALLRQRGAAFIADSTERAWRSGQTYYLDPRGWPACRGMRRMFECGNRQCALPGAQTKPGTGYRPCRATNKTDSPTI